MVDPLPFSKIKLFKSADIQPRKPSLEAPEEETAASRRKRLLLSQLPFLLVVITLSALALSYLPSRGLPTLKLGEIASSDIVAPTDLTVEDPATTEQRRAEAENSVVPVYTYDPNVFANTEDKIRRLFGVGREWVRANPSGAGIEQLRRSIAEGLGLDLDPQDLAALVRLKFPAELEETLVSVSEKIFSTGVILSKNLFIHGEADRGLALLNLRGGEKNVAIGEVYDLKEAEDRFAAEIARIELPSKSRSLLRNLGQILLTPNITYNKIETENRKSLARAGVPDVTYTIKKGRVLIRKGDEAGPETVKLIDLYNQRLQHRSSWLPDFAASFLLYLILFGVLWLFFRTFQKETEAAKSFRMAGAFQVVSLALYKVALALGMAVSGYVRVGAFTRTETYYYAIPWQMGVIAFAFLVPDQAAFGYVVLNALTAGYLLGANFYLTVFSLIGGLAAIHGVRRYRRRHRPATLRAGLFIIPPVNAAVIFIVMLLEKRLSSGALAAEVAFGFITASKLMELTNSDLPVFKQMAVEAPGSYHHSLVVGMLAEKAAEDLGLDSQLAKAGGLYHDIGKTKMPEYFIENRTKDFDLHKDLTPSMSTLVIINHVKEGAEIAKKMRLPKPLQEIIEQHHGNSLVRYFYNKAKLTYDPEEQKIGEEDYRYPGPPPQSKEAALVMLADSVEAASRSLKAPTKDNIKRVITDIINAYLQDGQLDGCDFSLRDLRTAASSFLGVLFAIYHPRVEYPGFEFEASRKKKPAPAAGKPKTNGNHNHDRDHQPPEKTPGQDSGV
jgi:putative nucleotidyltransferase with HDIG domain